jgi:thiamine biosynthesis lipoprotein
MDRSVQFRAMNTEFLLAGLPTGVAAEVQHRIIEAERKFSRFLADSEISRINETPDEWVPVSPLACELLTEALAAVQATEGLFNPFMGLTLQTWGYDRSFELLRERRARPKFQRETTMRVISRATHGMSAPLAMNPQQLAVRLDKGVSIDVGGIAKGWVAQREANGLIVRGIPSGLIDAGGDVVVWGQEPEQGLWGIGVANPMPSGEDVASLWLEGLTAMATSSIVKRSWQTTKTGAAHHILDPRTGAPAVTDFLQVTVIGRNLSVAEQYAKCLIVLGSSVGLPWLEKRQPELAYIGLCRDGSVYVSANLDKYALEWEVKKHVKLGACS